MRIKNLLLLYFFMMILINKSFAQDSVNHHIIRIAPTGLLDKLRLHYEFCPGSLISLGVIGTYYYKNNLLFEKNLFSGIKGEAFMRIYFKPQAPEGVYFQPSLAIGRHRFYADSNNISNSFNALGGAVAIGYQNLLGIRKNIPIDFNIGLQLYSPDSRVPFKPGNAIEVLAFIFGWRLAGPGAFVTPKFSIGFAF